MDGLGGPPRRRFAPFNGAEMSLQICKAKFSFQNFALQFCKDKFSTKNFALQRAGTNSAPKISPCNFAGT